MMRSIIETLYINELDISLRRELQCYKKSINLEYFLLRQIERKLQSGAKLRGLIRFSLTRQIFDHGQKKMKSTLPIRLHGFVLFVCLLFFFLPTRKKPFHLS